MVIPLYTINNSVQCSIDMVSYEVYSAGMVAMIQVATGVVHMTIGIMSDDNTWLLIDG